MSKAQQLRDLRREKSELVRQRNEIKDKIKAIKLKILEVKNAPTITSPVSV